MTVAQSTARARMLRAPNPGPMTLEGTNTWLLAEPGAARCIVVDPGPDDAVHLDAISAAAAESGLTIDTILLTHGHPDHSAAAPALARRHGATILASDPAYGERLPSELEVDGLLVQVIPTPGHSVDSVCFLIPSDNAVLTGDHVLGRGTTVVEYPEGRMGDYLASLVRIRGLDSDVLLPGHGPVVTDPAATLDRYVRHREERLDELRSAVAVGDATPGEMVRRIYPDLDVRLVPIAELTVRAGLQLLIERGSLTRDGEGYDVA